MKKREEYLKIRFDDRKLLDFGQSKGITLHPDWYERFGEKVKNLQVMFNNYFLVLPPDITFEERTELEKLLLELEKRREKRIKNYREI